MTFWSNFVYGATHVDFSSSQQPVPWWPRISGVLTGSAARRAARISKVDPCLEHDRMCTFVKITYDVLVEFRLRCHTRRFFVESATCPVVATHIRRAHWVCSETGRPDFEGRSM